MIRFAIRRPVAVTMAYFAVALLGVAAWRNIPIELLPDTQLPQLSVDAYWSGASPEVMEAFVTSPIEGAVQQVRGVQKVTSISDDLYGYARAQVGIEFARGTDMDFARLELSERLGALQDDLPPSVFGPTIRPYVPEELREQQRAFLSYTLTGPHTLEALGAHLEDRIEPELLQVDGVAAVEVQGLRERLLEIRLDERRINALGLSPERVRQRVAELEYVGEAGRVASGGTERTLAIRHTTASADEIRRAGLLTDRGRIVRVQDVATVHDTYEEAQRHYRIDGQPAVAFELHKEIGVNTVAVADRVKAKLTELESLHPSGVRLILDEDESEAIKKQLTDLRSRALIAGAVIFAVLLLFLRSFRSAAIVFATIAFSILIALNFIYFGGFTLNVLTLMGLAMGFGLIVDNAIVVLENIYRKRESGRSELGEVGAAEMEEAAGAAGAVEVGLAAEWGAASGGEIDTAPAAASAASAAPAAAPSDAAASVEEGARQVVLPILAATLTTLIVFVPFVYLQDELRVYYVPLAIVVGMSLLASLFVAFTFIPALAAKLLDERYVRVAPSVLRTPLYVRVYAALLGVTLRFPWVTVLLAAAMLAGSWHLFNRYVTRGVLWSAWWGQQTYIDTYIRLPRGDGLERTDELARHFEDRLRGMPELERYVTNVQPQFAQIRITFPDSLEHTPVPVAIKDQLVAYSLLFGGAEVRVYGYGPSFYGGGGSPPNYTIQVAGYNYQKVREIAEDLGRRLERFPRVRDVDANSAGGWQRDKATEFVLRLDRDRLALHDLTARDVVWQVAASIRGQMRRDQIRIGGEEMEYQVKFAGNEDMDVLELQELLIQTPSGRGVRLANIADLSEREVLSRIIRENQQYRRYVSYEFRGPTKLGDRIRDAVMASTELPNGYTIDTQDEWRWSWEEQQQIWGVLAVSLILVFMITAALFESLRQPLCVLLTVPMALAGVFLMFFYTNASFTREAWIGVIMMGGIVVNNAILLVDHVNHLRRADDLSLREATVRGTLERVRPILMTSATTILGLLPLVLFSEYADANIWNALGFALIGGLTSSTLFVLTVTPALYLLFERGPEQRRVGVREAIPVAV